MRALFCLIFFVNFLMCVQVQWDYVLIMSLFRRCLPNGHDGPTSKADYQAVMH